MKKHIYYIIVTFKPDINVLKKTIKVLSKKNVIIVNNILNNNDTLQQNIFPGSKIINNNNVGYAGGINIGIKHASRANWIIIMNQDTEITAEAIKYYEDCLGKIRDGIAGPFSGNLDQRRWTTIYPSMDRTDYLSGSFMAISRNVVRKTGCFYEPYFMYYEDVDYCQKALKNNIKLLCLPHPGIRHTDAKDSFLHQYYLARNHLLFVKRQAPIKVKVYEILRLPKTIWGHIQNRQTGAISGIKDFIFNHYGKY